MLATLEKKLDEYSLVYTDPLPEETVRYFPNSYTAILNNFTFFVPETLFGVKAIAKKGYELDEDSFVNHLLKEFAYVLWPSLAQKYDFHDDLDIYSTTNPALLALDYAMFSVAESLLAGLHQLLLEEDIELDLSEIPFTSSNIEDFIRIIPDCLCDVLDQQDFKKYADLVKEFPCLEDYSNKPSKRKTDFYRKWYHTRTKHPQVSLEEYQDNYAELNDGDQWEIPDPEVDVNLEASANAFTEEFFDRLDKTDQKILAYRMNNYTYQEIAEKLGYKTHSTVLKKMKYIEEEFIYYVGRDYNLTSYLKPEYRDRYERIIDKIWIV